MLDGLTPIFKALYEFIKNDALLVQVIGGLVVVFLAWFAARAYGRRDHTASSTTEYDTLTRRNRRVMIEKVRAIWVTGFLEKSLAEEARLELGLSEVPDAVEPTLDLLGRIPGQPSTRVPEGTPIMQVFDDHAGELLILGAPGAGKTTLLLELARDLLTRAVADETCAIPVIFPLSTWAAQRHPLADWLVDELRQRYDVPRKVAEFWVANNQILPLLDGLDEVQQDARQGCIVAINQFRHDKGLLSLAICCRQADYEAIDASLQLQGAVFVHPLTQEQVTSYLQGSGEQMQAFLTLLHEDPTLWELLSSPLMLNLVVLAYSNQSLTTLQLRETTEARQQHLFSHYIDRMFQHRGAAAPYSREQTQHWLQWLASQMQQRGQSVFYIERMQPDWLPQKQVRIP